MKNKTVSTNKLKQGFGDKSSRLFVAASLLLFLLVLFFSEKPVAQMVNQEDISVNQEVLSLSINKAVKDVQGVNQEALIVDKEVPVVNQEVQAVNPEVLRVNQEALAVNQKVQNLIKQQIKSSFKQITFKNLEPAPVNFWYQAEVGNQVIYFSPTQKLMFVGEVYTNDGYSLSEQTRRKWQSMRAARLDLSAALIIGNGVIEVIEFIDTDCRFCQLFDRWITTKNDAYKDRYNQDLFTRKIVLTPIDGLHPNAHKEAVHILCQSPENFEAALTQTLESKISFAEMDSCQQGKDLLLKHRKIAKEFGVFATPTLVINGQIIQGFNPQKLEVIIKQQLNKQGE